jgi:RecJ-like exonuclease
MQMNFSSKSPDDLPPARVGDETPPGSPQSAEGVCPRCGGAGKYEGKQCPDCDGSGVVMVIVGDS